MKRILALALIAGLPGCASFGNQAFSCNGLPKGVTCQSATDVYKHTNAGFMPRPESKGEGKSDKGGEATPVQPRPEGNQSAYILPKKNIPVPIVMPPQVMRIWFAPWQDKASDLHWPEYVFTEIESRKWVVGGKVEQPDFNFYPLEVRTRVKTQGKKPESLTDFQKK